MAFVTENVYRAEKGVRAVGVVLFCIGAFVGVVGLMVADLRSNPDAIAAIAFLAGVYFVTGGLLYWFAAAMLNAKRWGAIAAMTSTTIVSCISITSIMTSPGLFSICTAATVTLPATFAAVLCWTAMQDLKSRRNDSDLRRGFEVLSKSGRVPTPPPPSTRLVRRREPQPPQSEGQPPVF